MEGKCGPQELDLRIQKPFSRPLILLIKALVKGTHWRIPERKEIIHYYDFEKRIGWFGNHFVRLVDDVFLFHGHWKDDDYQIRKWSIIRVLVP